MLVVCCANEKVYIIPAPESRNQQPKEDWVMQYTRLKKSEKFENCISGFKGAQGYDHVIIRTSYQRILYQSLLSPLHFFITPPWLTLASPRSRSEPLTCCLQSAAEVPDESFSASSCAEDTKPHYARASNIDTPELEPGDVTKGCWWRPNYEQWYPLQKKLQTSEINEELKPCRWVVGLRARVCTVPPPSR